MYIYLLTIYITIITNYYTSHDLYLQHQGIQNFSRWLEQQKKQSSLEKNILDGEKHRLALVPLATPASCASSRL